MARYSMDGMIRVDFVPTITDISAPTVAQLAAGTALSLFINKDGLTLPADQNMVDSASLAETFDAQVPGSFGGSIELNMKKNNVDADDIAWNLFVYNLEGFLAVRRGVPSAAAWAAAQRVLVYPVLSHEPVPVQTATNTEDSFTVLLAVTSQPAMKAVVAT